jgi:D-inositol-3-phosphate glycosyltransferase
MKQKIAFISEHASPLATLGGVDAGGQNVYVAELARELASGSYSIDVYTRRSDPNTPEVVEYCRNVNVIHIKAGPPTSIPKEAMLQYMDELTSGMLDYMKKSNIQYQLIHANFFMSALVASNIKRILGIPYVVTFHALGIVRQLHQQGSDNFPPERISVERFVVRDADLVIAECPQDRNDLVLHYDADPAKVTVVQCGFNPAQFYPIDKRKAREQLGLPLSDFILLQLGRMVPRKGVDNVIRALSHIHHKVKLLIVGGEEELPEIMCTPEIKRLLAIAERERTADSLKFVGRKCRDDLKYYYSAADLFITTPWYEPFGITPLESMACGTPVIGANVGGIKYSVANGITGLLVPPNDPQTLASTIDCCIDHPSLLEKMRRRGLRWVNEFFTWKYVAQRMDDVYRSVTQAKFPAITVNKYEFAA